MHVCREHWYETNKETLVGPAWSRLAAILEVPRGCCLGVWTSGHCSLTFFGKLSTLHAFCVLGILQFLACFDIKTVEVCINVAPGSWGTGCGHVTVVASSSSITACPGTIHKFISVVVNDYCPYVLSSRLISLFFSFDANNKPYFAIFNQRMKDLPVTKAAGTVTRWRQSWVYNNLLSHWSQKALNVLSTSSFFCC